ncbi:hypothetical protein ElyMa_006728200 [Elysia marginata]|uniref:Uncharacterized protein n=1 Tax=Elysia marginata TaxID=1093978 RepID=A0AAV4IT05_9GAST|nr:hypothetical protein ElyMa_006728200 [Elysia marginata]
MFEQPNISKVFSKCSNRNPGELAPPAYIDISQSCSSMCPSFVSHDDHNEAPPTYEETCGTVYVSGSENSLSQQPGPHRNSSQDSRNSSLQPNSPSHLAIQQFSEVENNDGGEDWRRMRESPRSNLLSPANSGALMAQAAVRRQRQALPPLTLNDSSDQQQPMLPPPGSSSLIIDQNSAGNAFIGSPENLSHSSQVQSPDSGRLTATAPPTPVPPGLKQTGSIDHDQMSWSRRSFSSIPSYTCLLGKSGEVSAQIFDTSSIIQGMMPPHSVHCGGSDDPNEEDTRCKNTLSPTLDGSGSSDALPGHSAIPARSHSLSSVVPLRVGVPYKVCQAQGQLKSPVRSHGISSPLLSSPQHSVDVISQSQQHNQHVSSHIDANSRSSTSPPAPNSASDAQSYNQSDSESSEPARGTEVIQGQRMYNLQTSKITSSTSIDQSKEACDEAQFLSECPAGEDKSNKICEKSTNLREENKALQVEVRSADSGSPVLSSLDIQETI